MCVAGQIIFDATGQVAIHGVGDITQALTTALLTLGEEQNVSHPLYLCFSSMLSVHNSYITTHVQNPGVLKIHVCK